VDICGINISGSVAHLLYQAVIQQGAFYQQQQQQQQQQ
jgi:hypothetical protein